MTVHCKSVTFKCAWYCFLPLIITDINHDQTGTLYSDSDSCTTSVTLADVCHNNLEAVILYFPALSKKAPSTIFTVFGMAQPGIELWMSSMSTTSMNHDFMYFKNRIDKY